MDTIRKVFKLIRRLHTRNFWLGFTSGCIYYGYIFFWLWSLYPLTNFGVSGKLASFFLILFVFFFSVVCMAFFWGLYTFFGVKIIKTTHPFLTPFGLASLFVLCQYAQAWGFGLFWLGGGTTLGPHWTLGNPAYFFDSIPSIVNISSVLGIYGIDFLLISLGSAMGLYLWKRTYQSALWTAVLIFTATIIFSGYSGSMQETKKYIVSIIQTGNPTKIDYTPQEIIDDFAQKSTLLKQAAPKSDIVIFPERAWFSTTLSQFLDPKSFQNFFKTLTKNNILIVDNNRVTEEGGLKSKVLFIDSQEGIVGTYDKKLLTPGGEFLPYIIKFPLAVLGWLSHKNIPMVEFARGQNDNVLNYGGEKIKVLVCSDIISPSISRAGSSGLIIELSSLGLFGQNKHIGNQILAMAKFRAVENKKYLILASHYGLSYIINPQGKVQEKTDFSGYQILTGEIASRTGFTWYNRLGDWPILMLSMVLLVIIGTLSPQCQKRFKLFFS